MHKFTLHKDDLVTITQFLNKYPDVSYVTLSVDSSSGIGSTIDININTVVNGDAVTITKNIADESSW